MRNKHHIDAFRLYLTGDRLAPANTVKSYMRDITQFADFLRVHNDARFEDVTPKDIRKFMTERRMDGIGAATLSRQLAAIREMFRHFTREGTFRNNAAESVNRPHIPRRLPRPLPAESIKAMLNPKQHEEKKNWIAARDAAVLSLLYGAGLRISEALSLRSEDTPDDPNGMILVRGKGDVDRYVPMMPAIVEAIAAYRACCPFPLHKGTALFRAEFGGPLYPRAVQRAVVDLRDRLGLPKNATPHALRHSFASHLLDRGVDLRSLQLLLGHKSIGTTAGYAAVTESKMLETFDAAHPRARRQADL